MGGRERGLRRGVGVLVGVGSVERECWWGLVGVLCRIGRTSRSHKSTGLTMEQWWEGGREGGDICSTR